MVKKIAVLVLIILILQACVYHNLEELSPAAVCQNDTVVFVSFSKHIQPVLTTQCAIAGCHSIKDHQGNLTLDASVSYSELTKSGSGYVDTINPRYSVLYSSIVSESNPMPPTGKLDPCTIDRIEKWMLQKAKNN